MSSLLEKAEALAEKIGADVETVFDEFASWFEGKKSAESPKETETTEPTASTEAADASAVPAETSAEASSEPTATETPPAV
jgi:hypothetical protein